MQPRDELRDSSDMTKLHPEPDRRRAARQPGSQKTEVWMGRTQPGLYFVFLCFDDHPELIRSHLARRENILKDASVTVTVDPFQERRIGVSFQVNPAVVQADASYSEPNGEDYSYDQVWDSEGRITRQGWMALIVLGACLNAVEPKPS